MAGAITRRPTAATTAAAAVSLRKFRDANGFFNGFRVPLCEGVGDGGGSEGSFLYRV